MQHALTNRPKVGGFPFMAETLRRAGVRRNLWFLPSCHCLYLTDKGPIATVGTPLLNGTVDIPPFNRDALISAIRTDQAGNSTFEEFLFAAWQAGIVRYEVDFENRFVIYYGCNNEEYTETYPEVEISREVLV